jgi:hypothetical protein
MFRREGTRSDDFQGFGMTLQVGANQRTFSGIFFSMVTGTLQKVKVLPKNFGLLVLFQSHGSNYFLKASGFMELGSELRVVL